MTQPTHPVRRSAGCPHSSALPSAFHRFATSDSIWPTLQPPRHPRRPSAHGNSHRYQLASRGLAHSRQSESRTPQPAPAPRQVANSPITTSRRDWATAAPHSCLSSPFGLAQRCACVVALRVSRRNSYSPHQPNVTPRPPTPRAQKTRAVNPSPVRSAARRTVCKTV